MPPTAFNPGATWTPLPLGALGRKFDPRFRYLLSLTFEKLEALHRIERETIGRIEAQIRSKVADVRSEKDRSKRGLLGRELADLYRSLFVPLTSGVHIPRHPESSWARLIDEVYFSTFVVAYTNAHGLKDLGVTVRTRSRDVFTAFIPRSKVEALAAPETRSVRFVELSSPLLPSLDRAMEFTKVDDLRTTPPKIEGQNVILGFVDKSLDIHHRDFQEDSDPTGKKTIWSRVLYLWDQSKCAGVNEVGVGVDPALPDFTLSPGVDPGVEYSRRYPADLNLPEDGNRATIQRELNRANGVMPYTIVRHKAAADFHGTAVAGCAAGNGRAQNGVYAGAAPGAEIIFVAYKPEHGTDLLADASAVKDGCRYIFERAKQLGRSCVVNLSLNDGLGPHDGTSSLETALDAMLAGETGRVITVSAGNTNDKNSHTSGTVAFGRPTDIVLQYGDPPGGGLVLPYNSDAAEIWYRAGDRFRVSVLVGGTVVIGPLSIISAAPTADGTAMVGGAKLTVTSTLADPRNQDNLIRLELNANPGAVDPPPQLEIPDMTIRLEAEEVTAGGAFHAWIGRGNERWSRWATPVAGIATIATPATAKLVIAVGAHDRQGSPSINGYSGCGPDRLGNPRPEIAAPGGTHADGLWMPLAQDVTQAPVNWYIVADGTSFSAPIVAGACALLFQCRGGTGGVAEILDDLKASVSQVHPPPDYAFGMGYLDMELSCKGVPAFPLWAEFDPHELKIDITSDPVLPPNPPWWLSPDVRVLRDERTFLDNPFPTPSRGPGHPVRVTVRNSSRTALRDIAVELYWSEFASGLTSIADWNETGITGQGPTSGRGGNNRHVVDVLPSRSETSVEFLWAPPHQRKVRPVPAYSLMARVVHAAAPRRVRLPSIVGPGGSVALRSILTKKVAPGGRASMTFVVRGADQGTSLAIAPQFADAEMAVRLPIESLPWRDRAFLDFGKRRRSLVGDDVARTTDVAGARSLEIRGYRATLRVPRGGRLLIPDFRPNGESPPRVEIGVRDVRLSGPRGFIHVAQISGGRSAGGVSLELR